MWIFSSRSYVRTFHPGAFVLHLLPTDNNVRKSANLVRPPWSLSSPVPTVGVGPLFINCSVFDVGIFHFSDTLQTKTARLDNLYHLYHCVSELWTDSVNSVGSQFARAVKVWLRDKAPLSFTHRALVRFGQTVLTFNIEVCMYLCVCVCARIWWGWMKQQKKSSIWRQYPLLAPSVRDHQMVWKCVHANESARAR